MWAFRRASTHLRNRSLSLETTRICSVKSEIGSCYGERENFITEFTQSQLSRRFHATSRSLQSFSISKFVSSLIGRKSSGDDNRVLEDHSSQQHDDESISDSELDHSSQQHDDESISDSELDYSVDELESESDVGEEESPQSGDISALTEVLLSSAANDASPFLDEWVEKGNEVTRAKVSSTMLFLRSRRLFAKACQLYEWLESRKKIEFTENDYGCRVDLIAKAQSWSKAEEYIQQIPESFRTEVVYNSLLTNYVIAANVNKSEKLFNKMKELFPLTAISCNTMLSLYWRTDREKIGDIVKFMVRANIKPSHASYQILFDAKGKSGNIYEMEQVFERMKSDGVKPSLRIRASLAHYYAAAGLKDKAEAVLKDMEGGDLVKNRAAVYYVLPVYASLGNDDEVVRIWRACECNPNPGECMIAVKAFGQIKRIEKAEEVFAKMLYILGRKPSSDMYSVMLDVYADHKMVAEGENLLRRMSESGVSTHMCIWDALVKLYIGVGEVEKADTILEEAIQLNKGRPRFVSFLKILEGYAARGDVSNAEKIFLKMREARYTMHHRRPYYSLLYAYINAKTPAYGFDQLLKEDSVVPDEKMARLLARANAFQASQASAVV